MDKSEFCFCPICLACWPRQLAQILQLLQLSCSSSVMKHSEAIFLAATGRKDGELSTLCRIHAVAGSGESQIDARQSVMKGGRGER